jgi:hypothetical protein
LTQSAVASRESLPRTPATIVAEAVVVASGLAFVGAAWWLDVGWLVRRFGLESSHLYFAAIERGVLVVAGLALILIARPKLGRWVARVGGAESLATCVRFALALSLSLVASEVGLRALRLPRGCHEMAPSTAAKDPRYGWLFKPSTSVTMEFAGRPVRLDFNADHNRARSPADLPDPARPTILFVGESVTAGHGLAWDETFPAIVGAALGVQVVDLGVDGYSAEQAFLRLVDALPRFERPVAIVTFFIPSLVDRYERFDHPRLVFDGEMPRNVPPTFLQGLRLTEALRGCFGYREEGAIQTTGEIFQRTARLAKGRGARALFVAPYLGAGWPRVDGFLVEELLVRPGLTVVDPRFGFEPIPGDNHPNAASTRRLAEAVASALAELAGR